MNFFSDANQVSSIFKLPVKDSRWMATWRGIDAKVQHTILPNAQTVNQAEHSAIVVVLKHIRDSDIYPWLEEATIYGDSQLAIYQLTGKYRVREPAIQVLWAETIILVHTLKQQRGIIVQFKWIEREINNAALGIAEKIEAPLDFIGAPKTSQ